jgi:hypothetical protein
VFEHTKMKRWADIVAVSRQLQLLYVPGACTRARALCQQQCASGSTSQPSHNYLRWQLLRG